MNDEIRSESIKKEKIGRPLLRVMGIGILAGLILLAAVAGLYRRELIRVYQVMNLFKPDRIVSNFRSMETIFDSAVVHRGGPTHEFDREVSPLPESYEYDRQIKSVADFLEDTSTTGLVVLRDGKIAFEEYYLGNTKVSQVISWSVAKSFVSALVGIAVEEGRIDDINQQVSDYLPTLTGSGYEGVEIKDILQMSSGIRFNEDYADFFSDINRLGRAIALNRPLERLISTLQRERTPGTYHHYISVDTQVLGMLLRQATGQSLASYLESRIWQRIGMESDAYWLNDGSGMAIAFGGLNAVLRDYARFGQLYLNGGRWDEEQVVPRSWVQASVTPDGPHLQPGDNPDSSWVLGYGYQWWIPEDPDGDYLAIGVYNQFIYVYPKYGVVIAKSSAYPDYTHDGSAKELETIAMFRAIARSGSTGGVTDPE